MESFPCRIDKPGVAEKTVLAPLQFSLKHGPAEGLIAISFGTGQHQTLSLTARTRHSERRSYDDYDEYSSSNPASAAKSDSGVAPDFFGRNVTV